MTDKGMRMPQYQPTHGRRTYWPILLVQAWLTLSVVWFAFGAWDWPVSNPLKLYAYVFLGQVLLLGGYVWGSRARPSLYSLPWSSERIVRWTILVTILVVVFTACCRDRFILTRNPLHLIRNPEEARSENNERLAEWSGSGPVEKVVNYSLMLASPFRVALIPLVFLYWPRLSRTMKWLAMLALLLQLYSFIATGTNKRLFDLVLLATWAIWLRGKVFAGHHRPRIQTKHVVGLATMAVLVMLYFTYSQYQRNDEQVREGFRFDSKTETGVDANHILMAHSPDWLQHTIASSEMYLCGGYYGLSVCLEQEWESTFGTGNSLYFMKLVEKFTGKGSVARKTYMGKAERYDGYRMMTCWHTAYPWIASDVSFPGALIIVFLYGMFFAMSWNDSLAGKNILAISVCSQFVVGLLYFSCNNQIVQSAESFCGFVPTFILWIVTRNRSKGWGA